MSHKELKSLLWNKNTRKCSNGSENELKDPVGKQNMHQSDFWKMDTLNLPLRGQNVNRSVLLRKKTARMSILESEYALNCLYVS